MKIAIFLPKSDFKPTQQAQLSNVGEVAYLEAPIEHPLDELIRFADTAEILAIDPDNFGGFETTKAKVTQLMEALPMLKGLALDTTSYGWVDLEYCKKRNILVSNCPGWSREAVAEHALALLLCLAKNIIKLDRETQKSEYKLTQGFELKGKTLGVIGVGNIGSRIAELASAIGMKVIGYNHSQKAVDGVEMKNSLDELLIEADAISINATHRKQNDNLIGTEQLEKMKNGVIIVNLADRAMINEEAMAAAIISGKIFGYAYEGGDLENTPLARLENVMGLKPFAWYTKEALLNLYQVWTDNIVSLASNSPRNIIS